ncbi:DHH family phosphoesterase [Candidatus Pacearchaeota archaeon]|nr:DHH family phosphoesterase [Candidatus Pacearchaeota archaeon]
MLDHIKNFAEIFLKKTEDKKIQLIGHFDTDGITSTAIMIKTLKRLGLTFSTKIIKQLTEKEISSFHKDKILVFMDLASGSIEELSSLKNTIFIIDHHEIEITRPLARENFYILNPQLYEPIDLCSSELAYLFSKQISSENRDLSNLAIIGMVGDVMEKNINKIRNQIIKEAEIEIKKGLLLYPSTRPLDKALEFSSRPLIPGITGNRQGVIELLKEAGIEKIGKHYKSLIDLSEKEMKDLVTAVMLKMNNVEFIGNLYLMKFFNKVEDVRELSAIINACSRMGYPEIALLLCLGNSDARKKAGRVYVKYRQHIISGLKYIENNKNIKGDNYVIINAKNNIKDTIIGTIASILSFSSLYKEGTIIVAMAYNETYIKVSARIAGRNSDRNLKKLLESITNILGRGKAGGHKFAAGCTIPIEDEERFIELIKKNLEIDMIKA